MILPISIAQFSKALPLFHHLIKNQPMCTTGLEGIYPGKVYVDDLTQPRTALLTTHIESAAHGIWCFLVGDPINEAFNQSLNTAIFSHQIIADNTPILFFTCDPDDWGGQMDTVLTPRPPIWFPRYHFISRQVGFDWQAALPPGFIVERMNDDLRHIPSLQLPEDVGTTLTKWQALTGPRFMDFGFVTLDHAHPQSVISSWATVDFIAAGAGDLGFFTQADYRHRGLGTITAAAVLDHGFANGLQLVNWTCDADNPGSTRAAERLGLERIEDYHQVVLIMDEKRHMAIFQQT